MGYRKGQDLLDREGKPDGCSPRFYHFQPDLDHLDYKQYDDKLGNTMVVDPARVLPWSRHIALKVNVDLASLNNSCSCLLRGAVQVCQALARIGAVTEQ